MPPPPDSDDRGPGEEWGRGSRPPDNGAWRPILQQQFNGLRREFDDLKGEVARLREKVGNGEQFSRENGWAIKRLEELLSSINERLKAIHDLIPDKRRAELVERVVFGLVALILVAVVGLWLKTIGIGR